MIQLKTLSTGSLIFRLQPWILRGGFWSGGKVKAIISAVRHNNGRCGTIEYLKALANNQHLVLVLLER